MNVLVAGGTGNVGRHIVRALLARGATVVVPSRSEPKLQALRARAAGHSGRLVTLPGNLGDEHDAARLRDDIRALLDAPLDAVVATLGRYAPAPSLARATRADLVDTLENYVVAHFVVARTFLPVLAERGGRYLFVNGPSAATHWEGSGLVSVATAAQAMLARVLAAEEGAAGRVGVTELVIHPSGYVGPDDTAGTGPIDGPAIGRYAAALVAGEVEAGAVVHLDSAEQAGPIPPGVRSR
jgi:NAD(P)-dependent dehydrogenase (short-subunit alcohol dehydrogenase family)